MNFQKIYENLMFNKKDNDINIISEDTSKLSNEEKLYFAMIIYLAKKCKENDIKYMLDRLDDEMIDKFGEFILQGIKDKKFDNIPEPLGDESPETILNFIKDITEEEANNLLR